MKEYPKTSRSRIAVEERFIVDVQVYLQELMDLRGFNKTKLAAAMGVSRGRISQIFSDECTNLTVRLLARAVHALGDEPEITSHSIRTRSTQKAAARRSSLIDSSPNVTAISATWIDTSKTDGVETGRCRSDVRLDGLIKRVPSREAA